MILFGLCVHLIRSRWVYMHFNDINVNFIVEKALLCRGQALEKTSRERWICVK